MTGIELVEEVTPSEKMMDLTPNKDGGVLKEIKKEGIGDDRPIAGEKVFVHYVGTLEDGTVFDSSRERGEQFEFMLGKGNVIKAWDLGVATMRKNEIAVLTCKSEYAYGSTGSPPKIPPNATLIFEIELFDWKAEDLSSDKDGGILRRLIEKGDGYITPNDGAMIDMHILGKYKNSIFEDREVTFQLGEGCEQGIVEGIEIALAKFKKGERSKLILSSKYAFGSEGKLEYNIPGKAEVEYEVFLKNFEKAKQSWEMDTDEKLEQSETIKLKGTNYFKVGKYGLAIKQYSKIISYLENESSLKGEQEKIRNQLLLAGHLNLAMCYLKLNDHLNAVKECDKALELNKENEKGLFRRGMAWLGLNDFDLAKKDFSTVLKLDPNNKAAHNQLLITNNRMKIQNEKDKKLYANMFRPHPNKNEKIDNEEVATPDKMSSEKKVE